MSFITDLKDLMPNTVTHKPVTTRDQYGKPTLGSGTDYTARVVYKAQRISSQRQGATGDVIAAGHVILAGTPTIGLDDEISEGGTALGLIHRVDRLSDESGVIYVKVYFGAG